VQVIVTICQEPDLQRLDQILDVGSVREERWTTTRVLDSSGIPSEKSMRGSGCGVTSNEASQFTTPIAN